MFSTIGTAKKIDTKTKLKRFKIFDWLSSFLSNCDFGILLKYVILELIGI
jgi:hypothetical protein